MALSERQRIGRLDRGVEVDCVAALFAGAVARAFAAAEGHVIVDAGVGRFTMAMPPPNACGNAWRASMTR